MRMTLLGGFVVLLAIATAPAAAQPIVDNFFVTVNWDEELVTGGGSGYNGGEWYYYPQTYWWNEWFYDHPYDPNRWKQIHIEFDAAPWDPGQDLWLDFAVNWSTPAWNLVPGHETTPPIPGYPGFIESLHIERWTFISTEFFFEPYPEHFVFDYVIPDYNPEWVSIDVSGWNFVITNGVIEHECIPEPTVLSLLAVGGLVLLRRR